MKSIILSVLFFSYSFVAWSQDPNFLGTVIIEEISLDTKLKFEYQFKDLKSFKEFNVTNLIEANIDRKKYRYNIFIDASKVNVPKEAKVSLSSLNLEFENFESTYNSIKEQVIRGVQRIY